MEKRKAVSVLVVITLSIFFIACGKKSPQEIRRNLKAVQEANETESINDLNIIESVGKSKMQEPEENTSSILIAYFTWAENTYVADPNAIDVDATTSASVLMPGNVGLLAQWIQEETGGDTFSVITEKPYSSNYDLCLNRAIEEHDSGIHPAIKGHVDNIDDYNIVFLGFPNWWYSCPMAILTFIEENNLSGKTIIPFCSHGTGGFASSLQDIKNILPRDCIMLTEFGAYRPEVAQSQDELLNWLSSLNITY